MKDYPKTSSIENSIFKIKSNLEKMSSFISKKTIKPIKRGRQSNIEKLKYFPNQNQDPMINQINIIPKRNPRAKNKSSHRLFVKKIQKKPEDKKVNDENDSESDYSNSYSREKQKMKILGDYKNANIYNYPTRKDVGLYSSEEENSSDNSLIEENFGMEIERILIEIYNKNISNIHNNIKKNKSDNELIPGEEHVSLYY